MRFVPRLGPLRFLALFVASGVALAVSRVPAVMESVRADLAAVEAWERAQDLADAAEVVVAPHRIREMAVTSLDLPNAGSVSSTRVPLSEREGLGVGLPRTRHSDLAQVPPLAPPVPGGELPALAIDFELHPPIQKAKAPPATAFALASQAYARLALGDRRAAASGLKAALAAAPADPNAPAWRAQVAQLTRHWSGEAYTLLRASGTPALGVAPLLGGGQSGARLTYTPDPLMRRPLALTARTSIAQDLDRIDTASALAAIGAQWRVLPTVAITVERLVAIGDNARNGWTLRTDAGIARHIGPVALDAFAEAGVVGIHRRDLFASLQARAATPLSLTRTVSLEPGIGLWSAVQRSDTTASRVDVGPAIALRLPHAAVSLDYRRRVAGNASPGNGATMTLSAGF